MSRSGDGVETRVASDVSDNAEKAELRLGTEFLPRREHRTDARSRAKRREPIPRVNVKVSAAASAVGGYRHRRRGERRRTWRRRSTSILRPIALAAGDKPEMADVPPGAERGRSDDQSRGVTGMLTFLTLALVVAALYFGREVLVPFALAVLLSFLLAPAVHWLRHLRAGRVAAVAVTVLVAFLAIFAFGGRRRRGNVATRAGSCRNTGTTSSRSCARSPRRYRCSASPRHFTRRPPI